jgi:hypothetical protein
MPHLQRWPKRFALVQLGSMETLLVVLVLSVFIAPVIVPPTSMFGEIVEDALISLMLLSGAVAVSDRRLAFIPIAVVAIVVIVVRWTARFLPQGIPPEVRAGALLFALVLLALVIAVKVFGVGAKVRDRLWGAVALYMLLGVIWAAAYEVVSLRIPSAYTGMNGDEGLGTQWMWVYFSFSTLTTVGYGDITPVARVARSLSNMEALIGQLYPAIVLARLVSLSAEDTKSDMEDTEAASQPAANGAAKGATKAVTKAATNAAMRADTEPALKPATKLATKPDTKPDMKPATEPDTKPDTGSDAGT